MGSARADSAPVDPSNPATPVTVSADPLPTAQIDGVAWSQVVVGNTVYVAGKFSKVRPAGTAAGTNQTTRNNLLAYDIRTGNLITTFAPDLNAQALVVAASPDGSRIYVGGDFTTANGQPRNRIAAYDAATGALVSTFKPSVSSQVAAIAVTSSAVYFGGSFWSVGSVAREKMAAVTTDGALLPWAPVPGVGPTDGNSNGNKATDNSVMAMAVAGSQVIVAGRFDSLNGTKSTGVGALDASTGATRPFQMGQLITNQGINAAINSLAIDGDTVYGTGYDFYGPGNLEGAFSASLDGGRLKWVADCHGDQYSVWPSSTAAYIAGHPHVCSNIGGFPQTDPEWTFHRALAFSKAATGTVGTETGNWVGQPAPSPLTWYPDLNLGTFTGQYQGPWSVSGNSQYVVYGGEFTRVNQGAQQGLVRFAVPSTAPNKVGPQLDSGLTPTLVSLSAGSVRVSWQTASDMDNETLTYNVIRSDRPNNPVYTTTAASTFWKRPMAGFIDTGLTAGTRYTYRVQASDPYGNVVTSSSASVTVSSDTSGGGIYADTVAADKPYHYWRLGESAGNPVSYDMVGFDDLTIGSGVTLGTPGALGGTTNTAGTFNGTDAGLAANQAQAPGPQVFSEEAWFRTTSTAGGKIVGFGNARTGNSSNYDRHIYMDGGGTVYFGVWLGFGATVQSSRPYNDGAWHHVVGTLGSGGMALYLDGQRVGQRSDATSAQSYSGYWRVGGDSTWAGANYFAGDVDEVAVYPSVLTSTRVARHFEIGGSGQGFNEPPTAAFTSSVNGLTAALDGRGSSDPEGPLAGYAWDFGDGATGSGATVTHTYNTAGTYRVKLTVTDSGGKQASVSHLVGAGTGGTVGGVYSRAVQADGARAYWRLGEPAGPAFDSIGSDDLTVGSGVTRATAGALVGDADAAATFDGTVNGLAAEQTAAPGPNTFSIEAWFNTTSTAGGKIVGYGDQPSGYSSNYDRHVYMDQNGTVYFGVWTGQMNTVQTAPGLNDGRWHHVVASLSSAGLALYVDGQLIGRNTDTTVAQPYNGYWRIGGDSTWAGANSFAGAIDDVAIYPAALSTDQVVKHYQLGTGTGPANAVPTAAFTSAVSNLAVSFDGSGSSDSDGTVASYAWDYGDGATGTGVQARHTYAAAGTYTVRLTVTDDKGATGTVSHAVTVTAPPANTAFAADAFERTVSAGLGTADIGGAWTAAPTSRTSVSGGTAHFQVQPGLNTSGFLNSVSASDVAVQVALTLDKMPTGGGTYDYVVARHVGSTDYRVLAQFQASGRLQLVLVRVVSGTETSLRSVLLPGTFIPGVPVLVRFEVSGSGTATLNAKAWNAGSAEPTTWQVSATDSTTALQAPGGVGVLVYGSSSATSTVRTDVDNLWAGPAGSAPPAGN